MTDLSINPGDGKPFLSIVISNKDARGQAHVFVQDVTPTQLRNLADELEAEIALAERRKKIEAALDAEAVA